MLISNDIKAKSPNSEAAKPFAVVKSKFGKGTYQLVNQVISDDKLTN